MTLLIMKMRFGRMLTTYKKNYIVNHACIKKITLEKFFFGLIIIKDVKRFFFYVLYSYVERGRGEGSPIIICRCFSFYVIARAFLKNISFGVVVRRCVYSFSRKFQISPFRVNRKRNSHPRDKRKELPTIN